MKTAVPVLNSYDGLVTGIHEEMVTLDQNESILALNEPCLMYSETFLR